MSVKSWKPLTKPMKGINFKIYKLFCNLNFAKTFLWAEDRDYSNFTERKTYFFSVHLNERSNYNTKLLTIIIWPIKLLIGW